MSDVDDGDYVPGDQTCNVCYGLTYYDAAMQATKRPFLCFGFRTNDEDPNPQACIEYEKLSAPVFDSYMCIGW